MSESVRYRIGRCEYDDGQVDWDIDIYRDGEWSGGCSYDTFAEAIAAYNEAAAKKAAT